MTRRNPLLTVQTVPGRSENGNHRLQLRQLIAVLLHKARGFLRLVQSFLNFIHAVGERIVRQQVQAWQNAVKRRNALFRLLELDAALLVVIFMASQRTLQLTAAGVELANFGFGSGSKATPRWLPIKRLNA